MAFSGVNSQADDLIVADDFEPGDLIAADTFNQIFDTLEKINRTIVDSDLVGVWSCDVSEHSPNTAAAAGWEEQGLMKQLSNATITLTASSGTSSQDSPYTISTSAPSPLYTTSISSSSGTYTLFNRILLVNINDSTLTHTYFADVVSSNRFELIGDGSLGPPQPTFITCNRAESVPAAPTGLTASSDGTGINLTWTDASDDESGFKVYRRLSNETEASLIATQTATTYSDRDLTEGDTAYYYVVSYNDVGDSLQSITTGATVTSSD